MNYRHEFHAGNFADVFKHIFMSRVLLHLGQKPAPFRLIETHAGSGLYDLSASDAGKTCEWRGGAGRLAAANPAPEIKSLIAPYLRIQMPLIEEKQPRYGGSPWIAKALLRRQDRLLLCELHPQAAARLRANIAPDPRVKIFAMDGYAGLKAFLPPIERRGLVFLDPPYEAADEFTRAAEALETAWRKWVSGIFMLWYPVKETEPVNVFAANLVQRGIKRLLRLELQIEAPLKQGPLARCGLMIVNPPFRFDTDAGILLPWLALHLGRGNPGFLIEWLSGE